MKSAKRQDLRLLLFGPVSDQLKIWRKARNFEVSDQFKDILQADSGIFLKFCLISECHVIIILAISVSTLPRRVLRQEQKNPQYQEVT